MTKLDYRRGDSASAEFAFAHSGATRAAPAPPRWPLRILAVESSVALTGEPPAAFLDRGLELLTFSEGTGALIALVKEEPAAVVAPTDMVGVPVSRFVEAITTWTDIPVVVGLSNDQNSGEHAYAALEKGARSILALPFTSDQLVAATKNLGFKDDGSATTLVLGPLTLEQQAHRLLVNGEPLYITPREFQLLRYLMVEHPRVISVDELANIGGVYEEGTVSATRVLVQRLRKKIADAAPGRAPVLETVRGLGYRLNE